MRVIEVIRSFVRRTAEQAIYKVRIARSIPLAESCSWSVRLCRRTPSWREAGEVKMITRAEKFLLALFIAALTAGGAATASETINYTYDSRGRLVRVVHSGTVNNNV